MYATLDYVRKVLAPHHDALCGMYDRAWMMYSEIPAQIRAIVNQDPRAVANVIWVLVNHEATKYFYDFDISPRPLHNTNVFSMPGRRVALRFKKTDSKGATSNYRTPRSNSFDGGLPLPDTPEPLRVSIGWVPNEAGTGYGDLLVSLRGPETWCYSILAADGGSAGLFDDVTPDERGPIVRPRHEDDADEAGTGTAGD